MREGNIFEQSLDEVLCCPTCQGSLRIKTRNELVCAVCHHKYFEQEGVLVLMPTNRLGEQINERRLREEQAKKHRDKKPEEILKVVSRHHCLGVMKKKASNFRQKFSSGQWILDVGCGTGYYWQETKGGGGLILLDFAFENLVAAKTLLSKENQILYIQADAASLPIKTNSLSGIWSVQTTQHFPDLVMKTFLEETGRILKNKFLMEIYNLNPAAVYKILYKLVGKEFLKKGKFGDKMIINFLGADELRALWKNVALSAHLKVGYSELFFHPRLYLKPGSGYISDIEDFFLKIPGLGQGLARQIQIQISSPENTKL